MASLNEYDGIELLLSDALEMMRELSNSLSELSDAYVPRTRRHARFNHSAREMQRAIDEVSDALSRVNGSRDSFYEALNGRRS